MPEATFTLRTYSIVEKALFCALVSFLPLSVATASFPEVSFTADSIEHENFQLNDVQGDLTPEGGLSLNAGLVSFDGVLDDLHDIAVEGSVEEAIVQGVGRAFRTHLRSGIFKADVEVLHQSGELSVVMKLHDQDILAFKDLPGMPPHMNNLTKGVLEAGMTYRLKADHSASLVLQLGLSDLGFDSPDGRLAGQALSLEATASAPLESWKHPVINGSITGGELLLNDFYRDFSDGELEFALKPRWDHSRLELGSVFLSDKHSLKLEGRAELGLGENSGEWTAEINMLDLQFPGAYERYMEPVAAAWTLDGLALSGRVLWSGQWSDGKFRSGDLGITDLSIVDSKRNRFAFTGLDARMRPGDHGFDSKLSWRGLLLGRINLGAGEIALDSEPGKFAITQPLVLDVLGGRVNLHELAVWLPGGSANAGNEPDIRLKADIEEVDMEQLTAALNWPSFSGSLSGEIPGVSLDDGILDVDGKILVNVFDGLIYLEDLRIERLFGVLPSLAANIEVQDLDLELLTGTFSFGQISGRVDGYMRDLRMLDWQPVAFDAWLGTPERQQDSRAISRKAVNRLTTLGGGRATTALTSPVMRLFSKFSYKRLGLGCRMQNNVCEVRGVSEDDASVLIMEGAGVPKITIRAFNRSVDWLQLLAQLVAASDGDSIRVGEEQ